MRSMPYRDKLARLRGASPRSASRRRASRSSAQQHLPHLDEVAWEFFGTPDAKDAVRKKVAALFPAHEVEQFTELFWNRVQNVARRRRQAAASMKTVERWYSPRCRARGHARCGGAASGSPC